MLVRGKGRGAYGSWIDLSVACVLISVCYANNKEEKAIVDYLSKNTFSQGLAEYVFVLDRSGSVGAANFELQRGFVESFLTHVVVDVNASRVAVISYSDTAECHIDYLRNPKNKCILSQEIQNVVFQNSRATNTAAALEKALEVFQYARLNVKKILIYISDGLATLGGDPLVFSDRLKAMDVEIFCFGIGRYLKKSLLRLATSEQHVYSCSEFRNFGNLVKRIRGDSHESRWSAEASTPNCDNFCDSPYRGEPDDPGCCDHSAQCSCALQTGMYTCVCGPGFYGLSGLVGQCKACPQGTFKSTLEPTNSCTRCPAGSTTVKEASISIMDCICKEGYKGDPSEGAPCTLITCPPLQNPTHGYIWGDCEFTFGSECNFACKDGYQLVNPFSDFRKCESNGQWSGHTPICRQILCNAPLIPRFGSMDCDGEDMTVGRKCRFSCEMGYVMEGSPERECSANAQWSGKEVNCFPIQCGRAPHIQHGQVFGCQTDKRLSFKEACAFMCVEGFKLVGPAFIICNESGQLLSSPGYEEVRPSCQDVTPPVITCPEAVVASAEKGKNSARIHLKMPEYADNSGIHPKLLIEPQHIAFQKDYPIGNYTVRFIAVDHIGLESFCEVLVRVYDDEPPTVVTCPSKVNATTDNLLEPVLWDEPIFEDNSKKPVTIIKSHTPGDQFEPGRHTVTYQAFDAMNNQAKCVFDIIVTRNTCPYHPPPTNGAIACNDWWYGQICHIYCNERYDFVEEPAEWYTCTSDSNWETVPIDFPIPWPDCAKPSLPIKIRRMLKGFYYQGDCNDPQVSNHIKEMFLNSIKSEFKKAQLCVKDGTCNIQSVKLLCGKNTDDQDLGGKTNAKRMKRNVWQLAEREDLELEFEITLDIDQELDNTEEMLHQFLETIQGLKWDTEDFEQQPTTTEATFYPSHAADLQYLLNPSNENETYGGTVVFTDDRTELVCRPGSVLKNEICVLCSPGTYYDVLTQKCWDCPLGQYQEYEGQMDCQRCPRGMGTENRRAKHLTECKGICQPGSFSASGLETCMACPLGTYQEFVGQDSCVTCPDGKTTAELRSTSVSDCRDTCEAGSHSKTGLTPCDPCPKGYYQSLTGQDACDECPANFSTLKEGARNESECLDVDPCADVSVCKNAIECVRVGRDANCVCQEGFLGDHCEMDIDECALEPCQNSATCMNGEGSFWCLCREGFTGKLCEVEVDECSFHPCVNNGTCMDKENGYVCICPYGFEGLNCEKKRNICFHDTVCLNGECEFQVETNSSYCYCAAGYEGIDCSVRIDECQNVSCLNNGRCIDGIASFRCVCNSGYTGKFCEVEIDECEMNLCSAASTCQDLVGTYKCLCPPGYSGNFCETKQDSNFLLNFPESSATIANMATLNLQSALSEVTVSMWVQTTDTEHSGTPLSYAVASVASTDEGETTDENDIVTDNALTISDCSGVHVYVNNEPIVTDVRVADGQWHHLAFTWASDSGSWNLYKDGKLQSNGTNLKPSDVIQKGGTIVIGQEQDSVGGSFSPFETFTGNITRVNIWNSSFSKSNITRLCSLEDDIPGKVVAWPDFLQGIKGDVNILNDERPSLNIENLRDA